MSVKSRLEKAAEMIPKVFPVAMTHGDAAALAETGEA
jgi:hypothetical protein